VFLIATRSRVEAIGPIKSGGIAVAVLDFDGVGIPEYTTSLLTERFRHYLSVEEQCNLLERKKMKEMLNEMATSQTGLISDNDVIKTGRLIGVRYMFSGIVGKLGKKTSLQIKMFDVETGIVLNSSERRYADTPDKDADELLYDIGIKEIVLEYRDYITFLNLARPALVWFTLGDIDTPSKIAFKKLLTDKRLVDSVYAKGYNFIVVVGGKSQWADLNVKQFIFMPFHEVGSNVRNTVLLGDPSRAISKKFKIKQSPTILILNKNGDEVSRKIGSNKYEEFLQNIQAQ